MKFIEKIDLFEKVGQHSRSEWLSEEEETSLLMQNKYQSMIIHKSQGWPQTTKTITTKKIDKNHQGRSPTVPTTATIKNNKDNNQQYSIPHRYLCHYHKEKPPPTNAGRLIQPNGLLKVLAEEGKRRN